MLYERKVCIMNVKYRFLSFLINTNTNQYNTMHTLFPLNYIEHAKHEAYVQ